VLDLDDASVLVSLGVRPAEAGGRDRDCTHEIALWGWGPGRGRGGAGGGGGAPGGATTCAGGPRRRPIRGRSKRSASSHSR
jgi:hypothetical protein